MRISICCLSLLIAIFIFYSPGYPEGQPKKDALLEKRVTILERDIGELKEELYPFTLKGLPEYMSLCGKKIPIFRPDIRERFEREFFLLLDRRGLLSIIIKRYFKYLDMINTEIERVSLPSDLIYLVVTESYLNPRAISGSNAAGMWQFIKETGRAEGLMIDEYVDERYDMMKATRAALNHLKALHKQFNDWLIAMAAYNAGSGRLRSAIENQKTKDFFELYLPEETERYVFRVMAIKEIITERGRYGLDIPEVELYRPLRLYEVAIETDKEIDSYILAEAMELPYKAYRDCNIHLKRYKLPKGRYHLNVPFEKKDIFLTRIKDYPYITIVK